MERRAAGARLADIMAAGRRWPWALPIIAAVALMAPIAVGMSYTDFDGPNEDGTSGAPLLVAVLFVGAIVTAWIHLSLSGRMDAWGLAVWTVIATLAVALMMAGLWLALQGPTCTEESELGTFCGAREATLTGLGVAMMGAASLIIALSVSRWLGKAWFPSAEDSVRRTAGGLTLSPLALVLWWPLSLLYGRIGDTEVVLYEWSNEAWLGQFGYLVMLIGGSGSFCPWQAASCGFHPRDPPRANMHGSAA